MQDLQRIHRIARNTLRGALGAVLVLALAACGGSKNNAVGNASIRLVNATPASDLNAEFNGTVFFGTAPTSTSAGTGVGPGSTSSYSTLGAGSYSADVAVVAGTALASLAQTVNVGANSTYSLVAFPRQGTVQAILLTENITAPATGFARFQVFSASVDPGALDIYVVPHGSDTLTGLSPTISNVPAGGQSAAVLLPSTVASTAACSATNLGPCNYDVVVTAFGNQNDIRLVYNADGSGGQTGYPVPSGAVVNFVLTSSSGGALVSGVMVPQVGTNSGQTPVPVLQTNQQARVRLVGAMPASSAAAITASVGSQALTGLTAPTVGGYQLVAGGTSTYTVAVNGATVPTLPAATFAAGGDYTVMAYGTAASPLLAIFSDSNQYSGGEATVRLVNGAVSTSYVTMSIDSVIAAPQVNYGAASGYEGVTATNSAVITLSSPDYANFATSVATGGTLTVGSTSGSGLQLGAGDVYTLFLIGAEASPVAVVVKDR